MRTWALILVGMIAVDCSDECVQVEGDCFMYECANAEGAWLEIEKDSGGYYAMPCDEFDCTDVYAPMSEFCE